MLPRLSLTIAARREARGLSQADLAAQLGIDVSTLCRYERGEVRPKKASVIAGLCELLAIAPREMDALYLDWLSAGQQRLTIRGMDFLHEHGLDEYQLLHRLIEIDLAALPQITQRDEGTVDQWAPIFMHSPDSWRLLTDGARIVGYWHYLFLTPEAFAAIQSGARRDSELTCDDVIVPIHGLEDGPLRMYLVMIALDPVSFTPFSSGLLIRSLLAHHADYRARGLVIAECIAMSLSPGGDRLCARLGLSVATTLPAGPGGFVPRIFRQDGAALARTISGLQPPARARGARFSA